MHREEKDWIRRCSAITIDFNILMLDDRGFYVIVLWSGLSGSYNWLKKIIILERTNFIWILYTFCVKKILYASDVILCKKLCILNFLSIVYI
jgi:hypothetical protein